MKTNYVYFVRNPKTREIKIGQSEDVPRRLKELVRAEQCELELLATVEAPLVEKELHKRFDVARTRGEWFTPNTDLLEYIVSQKAYPIAPENEEELPDWLAIAGYIILFIINFGFHFFLIIGTWLEENSPASIMEWAAFIFIIFVLFVWCGITTAAIISSGGNEDESGDS